MKITSASKKVLCSALSAAMIVAFAPTMAFAGSATSQQANSIASVASADGKSVTYYDNLEEALKAAAEGDTVTLLGDVSYNDSATDNLYEDSDNPGTLTVKAGVTFDGKGFTIKDAVKDHGTIAITVKGSTDKDKPTVVRDVTLADNAKSKTAALTVEDQTATYVTISGVTAEAIAADDITTISGSAADEVSIDGNEYTTSSGATATEKTVIESGEYGAVTIEETPAVEIKGGTYESIVNSSTSLSIKGGTFTGGVDADGYRYALENHANASTEDVAAVTISGGDFTGYIKNDTVKFYKQDGLVSGNTQFCTTSGDFTNSKVTAESATSKYYTNPSNSSSAVNDNGDVIGGTATQLGQDAEGPDYVYDTKKNYFTSEGENAGLSSLAQVYTKSADNEAILVKGGTFLDDPSAWLDTNVSAGQDEETKIWSVGTGVTNDAATIASIGDGATSNDEKTAKKAVAAATSAWLESVKALTMPAELAFDTAHKNNTIVDLYTEVIAEGAQTELSLDVNGTYFDVKDVTESSTAASQAKKASFDAIEAAAAAANLTTAPDKDKAEASAADPQYTQFYSISAKFNGMCDASSLGEGNEVTYYIKTASIKDYSDNYAYSIVFADGTIVPGTFQAAITTGSADSQRPERIAFKTAKTGNFALAYTDTVADTKAELEELQAELDAAKAELEQAKKDSEAAAAAAAAQVAALQDQVAAASVAGKTKTVTLGAKKTKTAKAKSVTLAAVASASGATMTFAKASGSAKITVTEAGKVKLVKGVKRGTYKATVTAAVGTALKNVTVKFVIQ